MKVSVIIPNYNHEMYLKQRIESVLNQTYGNFEVIILDDSSTDNSKDVISSYSTNSLITNIVYNDTNSGSPFKQWKKGIELANGEYIWIAESDDFADLNFLKKMVPILERNEEIALAYCDSNVIDKDNIIKYRFSENKIDWLKTKRWLEPYQEYGNTEVNNYLGIDCTINNTSAVLFRRSSINNSNPFDRHFRYIGDWYFFLKVIRNNQIAFIPEPLNYYRSHDNHCSRNDSNNLTFVKEYFQLYAFVLSNYSIDNKKKILSAFKKYTRHYGITNNRQIWILYKELIRIDKYLFFKMFFFNLRSNFIDKFN